MTTFKKWLETYIDESDMNTDKVFEFTVDGTWNYMPVSVVLEFIKSVPQNQKDKIKDTMVKIDFHNGNMYHYLEYLAKGISQV